MRSHSAPGRNGGASGRQILRVLNILALKRLAFSQLYLQAIVSPVSLHDTVLKLIGGWIKDYNENHPHSALKWRSPREFRKANPKPLRCPVEMGAGLEYSLSHRRRTACLEMQEVWRDVTIRKNGYEGAEYIVTSRSY